MNEAIFNDASWYHRGINWSARLERELPVLVDVFGPPGEGGILDAGCGTGVQAAALAARGYRVTGADASPDMLAVARDVAQGDSVRFVCAEYANLQDVAGSGYDGLFCIGNSLAAAGSAEGVRTALLQFGRCLRPGGRLFVQVLNFAAMRSEVPCVRGPRVSSLDGQEYVSTRSFHFAGNSVQVTNITLWEQDGWHGRSHSGMLYAIERDELNTWCTEAGLEVDDLWSNYQREPFEIDRPGDLIVTATRADR